MRPAWVVWHDERGVASGRRARYQSQCPQRATIHQLKRRASAPVPKESQRSPQSQMRGQLQLEPHAPRGLRLSLFLCPWWPCPWTIPTPIPHPRHPSHHHHQRKLLPELTKRTAQAQQKYAQPQPSPDRAREPDHPVRRQSIVCNPVPTDNHFQEHTHQNNNERDEPKKSEMDSCSRHFLPEKSTPA